MQGKLVLQKGKKNKFYVIIITRYIGDNFDINKEETLFKEISYTLTSKKILYNIIFLVYSNNIG